jgi:hypothetical protein
LVYIIQSSSILESRNLSKSGPVKELGSSKKQFFGGYLNKLEKRNSAISFVPKITLEAHGRRGGLSIPFS